MWQHADLQCHSSFLPKNALQTIYSDLVYFLQQTMMILVCYRKNYFLFMFQNSPFMAYRCSVEAFYAMMQNLQHEAGHLMY